MRSNTVPVPASVVVPDEIRELIARGALFAVNHSGGKDSQAMYEIIKALVPLNQIAVFHADLGEEVEWDDVSRHVQDTIDPGVPFKITTNPNRSLIDMVQDRGMFPSPEVRQCTSDLKRGPIQREIRHFLWANPQFGGLIVDCMGMRAQESSARSKLVTFEHDEEQSLGETRKKDGSILHHSREWYKWLPIHGLDVKEVWTTIAASGKKPHPAYGRGMSRLSCRFCVMASSHDLRIAARHSPWTYAVYSSLERRTGKTMMMPKTIKEMIEVKVRGKVKLKEKKTVIQRTLEDITGVTPDPILIEKANAYLDARKALKTLAERNEVYHEVIAELAETGHLAAPKAQQMGLAL